MMKLKNLDELKKSLIDVQVFAGKLYETLDERDKGSLFVYRKATRTFEEFVQVLIEREEREEARRGRE